MRPSKRAPDEMRPVSFERGVARYAEGSCLVKFGNTQVLCAASLEDSPPPTEVVAAWEGLRVAGVWRLVKKTNSPFWMSRDTPSTALKSPKRFTTDSMRT